MDDSCDTCTLNRAALSLRLLATPTSSVAAAASPALSSAEQELLPT